MEDFMNYENQTFTECPEKVIGCNFTNCIFSNCQNTTFERCNIGYPVFQDRATFDRSNILLADEVELPSGCELIKSNVYHESDIHHDNIEV